MKKKREKENLIASQCSSVTKSKLKNARALGNQRVKEDVAGEGLGMRAMRFSRERNSIVMRYKDNYATSTGRAESRS